MSTYSMNVKKSSFYKTITIAFCVKLFKEWFFLTVCEIWFDLQKSDLYTSSQEYILYLKVTPSVLLA